MNRWQEALNELWKTNRVHVSKDTSTCYRKLAETYRNTSIIGFKSGERSGTWIAPKAWEVDSARLVGPGDQIIADWETSRLHLYAYSPPFKGVVSRSELEQHLFSIPSQPERIPFHFRNQYRHWVPEWGFCIPDKVRKSLPEGEYYVEINSHFEDGVMEMAEQVHRGELEDCLLLLGHFDHPDMCNDGLVGCLAGHEIISRLEGRKTHLTYRMLSTIEIIGSVFYAEHFAKKNSVKETLFIATSGANAPLGYQKSFYEKAVIDRIMSHVLQFSGQEYRVAKFRDPKGLGNDETAFDVQGVNIPSGSIQRSHFQDYHTNHDVPEKVDENKFEEMVDIVLSCIDVIESNTVLVPKFSGLPCLSHPDLDLYLPPMSVSQVEEELPPIVDRLLSNLPKHVKRFVEDHGERLNMLMTQLPVLADGTSTTLDVAERVGLPFSFVDNYVKLWEEKGLLERRWQNPFDPGPKS